MRTVHGVVDLKLIDDPEEIARCQPPLGKPFIRLTTPDGVSIDITTNIAEMIGGAGSGLRKRWEDRQAKAH